MPTVADAVRRHVDAFLEERGATLSAEQRQVLRAILACRTGELGRVRHQCVQCGREHVVGRSCGNRHCSTCQAHRGASWCARQLDRLPPCPHFLVTFTLPAELRPLARRQPREVYSALFEAGSGALRTLAGDPRRLGAVRTGFLAALHTWGRDLSYHPHVHFVCPAGGLDGEGRWRATPPGFFLPERPLAILYRAKLRDALLRSGVQVEPRDEVWRRPWVVDCQDVGDGSAAIKYLAPYVFRSAISDQRIVSCDGRTVTYLVHRRGSARPRRMTVEGPEFVRRLLQHTLPRGLQRVRHHGLLSPSSRLSSESLRWLVAAAVGAVFVLLSKPLLVSPERARMVCVRCGGPMALIAIEEPAPVAPRPAPSPRCRPP
jgi:hypothetical protein